MWLLMPSPKEVNQISVWMCLPVLKLNLPTTRYKEPARLSVRAGRYSPFLASAASTQASFPSSCRGSTPNSHQGDSPQFKVIFAPLILKISHMPQFSFSGGLR